MSITVRLWSKATLEEIKHLRADKKTLTVFMNKSSFLEDEIKVYPYKIRKSYLVEFIDGDTREVYATDDKTLLWFLLQEYHTESITSITEKTYRNVELKF